MKIIICNKLLNIKLTTVFINNLLASIYIKNQRHNISVKNKIMNWNVKHKYKIAAYSYILITGKNIVVLPELND